MMDFSSALEALKLGEKVAREGWNGKGMFIFLYPGYSESEIYEPGGQITMKTADDKFIPWLASQTDIMANDWVIV